MTARVLDMIQLADSSFPSGAYAHSFGLEWLDSQGPVYLPALLRVRLMDALARLELPVLREAYAAHNADDLLELDDLMDALIPVRELRQASRAIGHSFLRAAVKLDHGGLAVAAACANVEHQPVVFGAICHDWEIPLLDAMGLYAWQTLRQQLTAAQRLGRIGQSAIQQLLHKSKLAIGVAVEQAMNIPLQDAGAFAPWLDVAGMKHERQFARLFLS
jgi:urease accessory protein